MRKIFELGILATIAAVSCTVKMEGLDFAPVDEGTKVTLNVEGNLWTEDSKTAHTAGTGVALTGTEKIGLFYKKSGKYNGTWDGSKSTPYAIVASPTATPGEYSFTMPADAEGADGWCGIMPYSLYQASLTSNQMTATMRVGPVQFPEADSFDPHCDYLFVRPFSVDGDEGAKTGNITAFKRLFAPLCIKVTGLPAGSKIYTATISLSQDFDRNNALAGLFYGTFGDTFKAAYINYADNYQMGNALSAEYAAGLEAIDGSWPVWYMVNPITLKGGKSITLTVSTQDKTYTRTVTLPSDKELSTTVLNRITFNITGEGSTSVSSLTTDFTAQILKSSNKNMTASDGNAYMWDNTCEREWRSVSDDGGSGIRSGIRMYRDGGDTFTFPTIPGKNIVGAKIYSHPGSRANTGATVTLTVDNKDAYIFNLANNPVSDCVTYKGGYIDIALPNGRESLAGLTVKSATSQVHVISAITLFLEDVPIDPNDYYSQFLAGQDITIGGKVYNKSTNPVYTLTKPYEWTNANYLTYESNGIVFLDYDEADGKANSYTVGSNLYPENIVIIGRYKNNQPSVSFTNTFGIYPAKQSVAFKNVSISAPDQNLISTNSIRSTSPLEVHVEDCTLVSGYRYIFCDANSGNLTNNFSKVIVKNCVMSCPLSVISHQNIAQGSELPSFERFEMRNSVVSAPTRSDYTCISFRTNSTNIYPTPNADFIVDHCTFNNFSTNGYGIISLVNAKSVKFDNNVACAELVKGAPIANFAEVLSPTISGTVTGNRVYSSNATAWFVEYNTHVISYSGLTLSDNLLYTSSSPFTSGADLENLYLPVDPTKVTNGAGASYSTKLWKTWE